MSINNSNVQNKLTNCTDETSSHASLTAYEKQKHKCTICGRKFKFEKTLGRPYDALKQIWKNSTHHG